MLLVNDQIQFIEAMKDFVHASHQNSADKGFWSGIVNDNIPTKIALMHSELSEMLEAFRKDNPPCDKECFIAVNGEPRRLSGIEEEAADLAIRLADFCGRLNIDLGKVILAKMAYNATRSHMHGGKKC